MSLYQNINLFIYKMATGTSEKAFQDDIQEPKNK